VTIKSCEQRWWGIFGLAVVGRASDNTLLPTQRHISVQYTILGQYLGASGCNWGIFFIAKEVQVHPNIPMERSEVIMRESCILVVFCTTVVT
jgi:hypothetical protein